MSDVDWTYGAQHMWGNHKAAITEADETVNDIDAVWFDPDLASRSDRGVRVIGYSHSRRAILTVILFTAVTERTTGRMVGSPIRRISGVIGRRSDGREAGGGEGAG